MEIEKDILENSVCEVFENRLQGGIQLWLTHQLHFRLERWWRGDVSSTNLIHRKRSPVYFCGRRRSFPVAFPLNKEKVALPKAMTDEVIKDAGYAPHVTSPSE